jgi:hypothetical protein
MSGLAEAIINSVCGRGGIISYRVKNLQETRESMQKCPWVKALVNRGCSSSVLEALESEYSVSTPENLEIIDFKEFTTLAVVLSKHGDKLLIIDLLRKDLLTLFGAPNLETYNVQEGDTIVSCEISYDETCRMEVNIKKNNGEIIQIVKNCFL